MGKQHTPKHPSHEDGEVRDPNVAELQDEAFTKTKMDRLLKRAAKANPGKDEGRSE